MKDQRKKEKKEKKRKAELARRAQRPVSLAYHGTKYQGDEYVMPLMRAEAGILEAFLASRRKITDRQVRPALESLIVQMRKGTLPEFDASAPVEMPADPKAVPDLVVWFIRRSWEEFFLRYPRPSREDLIGILRTILASAELRASADPTSKSYLHFIEKFLTDAGVQLHLIELPEAKPAIPQPSE